MRYKFLLLIALLKETVSPDSFMNKSLYTESLLFVVYFDKFLFAENCMAGSKKILHFKKTSSCLINFYDCRY